jgi:Peptidase C39 family
MKITKFKVGAGLLVLVFLGFAIYVGSAFYIKNVGIELETDEVFDYSEDVEYFLQSDSRWGDARLGNSDSTLAQMGCTISDVAMVLSYLGFETDPGALNEELTQNEAYTENGYLLWYKLEEMYPVEYEFRRVFSSGTIEKDLREGDLPILRVKYGEGGFEHWVLVVGADGSDFLVTDPLNKSKTLTSLGEFGKVYAYRVITVIQN